MKVGILRAASLLLLAATACGGSTNAGNGANSGSNSGSSNGSSGNATGDSGLPAIQVAQSAKVQEPAASVPSGSLQAAVQANNAFAVDLYGRLTGSGNVITSPLSASLALTMTYAGAMGTTASQMATALHIDPTAGSIFEGQDGLTQALASRAAAALASAQRSASQDNTAPAPSPDDYQLAIVNSIWGEQTYTWAQPFLDTMATYYGTGVYLEDFVNAPDPARQAINTWVADETAQKILNLLPEGSVDATTRMVLVNAIHLKLPWEYPFTASSTSSAAFTRGDGSTVQADFMHQTFEEGAAYVDDGAAQIVQLPLSGGEIIVSLALPHGDLATYEAGLVAGTSASLKPVQGGALVQLALPKVTFTSPTFSLATALKAMGMVQAFDRTAADFTGLCTQTPDGQRLFVSDVLQKAMIAVQETGVEAAAATAVSVATAAIVEPTTTVTLDHPFFLSILDKDTGAVLFMGHVTDPTDMGGN